MIEWKEYKEECCVVVPVHKKNPIFFEQASFIQCVRTLGGKRDICLVAPFDLDLGEYERLCPGYKFKVRRLSKEFFQSIDTYNELCKRKEFYECFKEYEFILVYQLDCWVFDDNLDYFMSLGYDYIGAPWMKVNAEENKVILDGCGNGGFSLRNVDKFIRTCTEKEEEIKTSTDAEDVFFSKKCSDILKISPVDIGREFSFEVGPKVLFTLNGNKLPMGCHKPFLFQFKVFWKDYIKF